MLPTQSLTEIRRAEQAAALLQEEQAEPRQERRPGRTRAIQQAQFARQEERMVRYEQIITLRKQGMKNADIATQVGMAERTVRQWLTRGSLPHSRPRRERVRLIDPYTTYLLERWNQGCHNGVQLERELKAQGYTGSRAQECIAT